MSELDYVAGKYEEAVHALAVGMGSYRARLSAAVVAGYGFPKPGVIPLEIAERIDELHARLRRYEQRWEGDTDFAAAIGRMNRKTAEGIAELLYEIALRLRIASSESPFF
jgi:hypothetical protein